MTTIIFKVQQQQQQQQEKKRGERRVPYGLLGDEFRVGHSSFGPTNKQQIDDWIWERNKVLKK